MVDGTRKIRVLLANDRAVVRTAVRQVLERSGEVEVIAEAGDGEETLDLIRELEPDVAIIDVQMHRLFGTEVVREVQFNSWPVGVLILTTADEDPAMISILKSSPHGMALQMANPDDIVDAVCEVYAGKTLLNTAILPKVIAQVSRLDICPEIAPLNETEFEVLRMVARGMTNQTIGARLELSNYTVQWHLIRIFDKLQANNRTEAVTRALSMGVLQGTLIGTSEYVVFQN
jgi:DNA-binding NarL/FixJ family response regulator